MALGIRDGNHVAGFVVLKARDVALGVGPGLHPVRRVKGFCDHVAHVIRAVGLLVPVRHLPQLAVGVIAVDDLVSHGIGDLDHPVQGVVIVARGEVDERGDLGSGRRLRVSVFLRPRVS